MRLSRQSNAANDCQHRIYRHGTSTWVCVQCFVQSLQSMAFQVSSAGVQQSLSQQIGPA